MLGVQKIKLIDFCFEKVIKFFFFGLWSKQFRTLAKKNRNVESNRYLRVQICNGRRKLLFEWNFSLFQFWKWSIKTLVFWQKIIDWIARNAIYVSLAIFVEKKTTKVKLFIFSGNWMKNRILGESSFWSEVFSAHLADLSSICSDVNFGETIFLMRVKIFESFRMFRSKKQLVYNKSKISFVRVVENENGIWRVQRNISISFLLFS